MSRTWMRLSNGREELIVNPDHIKRLLDEGGTIIPDPRLSSEQVVQEVSTQEDAPSIDSPVNELVITDDGPVVRKRGKRSKE